jgi:hypothetical protein
MSNDLEFPIRILDNIISVEEQIYGFSLFNRGESLKSSLIDPDRVKAYIEQHQQIRQPSQPEVTLTAKSKGGKAKAKDLQKQPVKEDDWSLTLDYFKQNPSALLDAIPTPRNDENDLNGFESGLTPKKAFDFKFAQANGSSQTALGLHNRRNSHKDLMIL